MQYAHILFDDDLVVKTMNRGRMGQMGRNGRINKLSHINRAFTIKLRLMMTNTYFSYLFSLYSYFFLILSRY